MGMIIIKQYFIQGLTLMPSPILASFIQDLKPQPYEIVQKRTKIIEPKGRRILDTRQSKLSRISLSPISLTSPKMLQPRIVGKEKTKIIRQLMMTAFLRDRLKLSMQVEIIFSKTAIIVIKSTVPIGFTNYVSQIFRDDNIFSRLNF